MRAITILGYLAAMASMASFVPQAWKIIRSCSHETKDISVGMYLLTVSAFGLWLAYGVWLEQWPLVVSNAVCFILSGFILVMTLSPQSWKDRVSATLTGQKR
ncbi:MAG: PQ-loop domain-containing transporter [Pseudomonadota bacterium]